MRSTPLLRSPVTRLPTPQVQKAVVLQPINLKPAGNTVSVTTLADNPFEGRQRITVVTQASGGSSKPDPQMQSRRLMHEYLPGIGEGIGAEVAAARPAGVLDFLSTVSNQAGGFLAAQEQAKIEAARARQAMYNASQEEAKARRDAIASTWSNPGAAMARRSSITIPLLATAGVALVIAGVLFFKKKKG